MFISDQLVYVELHKTGSSHIRKVLNQLLDGELVGMHNQVSPDLFNGQRTFLGSVRNPWEWYLSLWAYGCDSKGVIYNRTTRPKYQKFKGLGWTEHPAAALKIFMTSMGSDPTKWERTYDDVNDVGAFRQWVRMINDPKHLCDLGEGFGAAPVSNVIGLKTFRYLKLFCFKSNETRDLYALATLEDALSRMENQCFIDYTIQNENLEHDLFDALEQANIAIPATAKAEILSAPKSNTSSRRSSAAHYYDAETEELVLEREKLLIEQFGYVKPSQQEQVSESV